MCSLFVKVKEIAVITDCDCSVMYSFHILLRLRATVSLFHKFDVTDSRH